MFLFIETFLEAREVEKFVKIAHECMFSYQVFLT